MKPTRCFSHVFTHTDMPSEMQSAVARLIPANPCLQQSPHVDKTMQLYDFYAGIGAKVILTRPAHFGKSTALSLLLHLHSGPMQFIGSALDTFLQTERSRWMGSTNYPSMTTNLVRRLYEVTPLEFRRQFPVLYFNLEPLAVSSPAALREYLISQTSRFNSAYETRQKITDLRTGLNRLLQAFPDSGLEIPAVFIDGFDAPLRNRWDSAFSERLAVMEELGEALQADTKLIFCAGRSVDPQLLNLNSWAAFENMSMKERYADLCGFTWEEVEKTYKTQLVEAQSRLSLSPEALKAEIQAWFGGYCFSNALSSSLLCPYSLTHFFSTFSFQSYRQASVFRQDISNLLKIHPAVLTSSLVYEERKDKALLQAGHDTNPFDLQEALGVLYRLGLLAPWKMMFPKILHLRVVNRCAAEMLAKVYVDTVCAKLIADAKRALLPSFQPDSLQSVLNNIVKNVSIEAFKAALLTLGGIEGIGVVHLGADYIDICIPEKYTLRVNIKIEGKSASFLRAGKQDLPKATQEYGLQLAYFPTANKAEILAVGELTSSGQLTRLTKTSGRPRKTH